MLRKLPRFYLGAPSLNLILYLVVLTIMAFVAFRVRYVYPAAFILASTWYGVVSRQLVDAGARAPDAIVSSDVVIACGIAALLVHVAIAGAHFAEDYAPEKRLLEFGLRDAVHILSEGLICAAVAPVIAAVMRLGASELAPTDIPSPADLGKALDELAMRSAGMAENMERLSNAIAASASNYESAAVRVSTALDVLAADVQAKAGSIGLRLSALESQSDLLGRSMAEATTEVRKVGVEASAAFVAINDAIQSLGALLDGMRDLVTRVNRFIRPDIGADLNNNRLRE
jgi:hypothetical protein